MVLMYNTHWYFEQMDLAAELGERLYAKLKAVLMLGTSPPFRKEPFKVCSLLGLNRLELLVGSHNHDKGSVTTSIGM